MFESSCDVNIGKLHKLHKDNTVKKTITMSLDNYFKRQTTSKNKNRVQIAAAQANLPNIAETEVHDAQQNACKKRQLSIKNKTR